MPAISKGMIIGGRYRLEAPLGRGGMGAVWTAHHLTLDVTVAIKFILVRGDGFADACMRFEREAKVAALLGGAHVVRVFDYGVEQEMPYLAMERLEGEDLGQLLARRGRVPLAETVGIVGQIAQALKRAADNGVVHRDLKPGNIFLAKDGDETIVKLLDFGVVKSARLTPLEDATQSGVMLGAPRYMSPEQVRGSRNVDHRADVWSLAVIIYRMLTGELPFRGNDVADLVMKICNEAPEPASPYVPALAPQIDAFFERALARDPAKRYQTAAALVEALAAIPADGDPCEGSQHGVARSLAQPSVVPRRRGRWAANVACALIGAACASAVWVTLRPKAVPPASAAACDCVSATVEATSAPPPVSEPPVSEPPASAPSGTAALPRAPFRPRPRPTQAAAPRAGDLKNPF